MITTTKHLIKKCATIAVLALTASTTAHAVDNRQVDCLARVIYHETRGESLTGQLAVAKVTLNRSAHDKFPDSVCSVIAQKGAYPWFGGHTPKQTQSYKDAYGLARYIMRSHKHKTVWYPVQVKNSLFFNNVRFKNKKLRYDTKIGGHYFYSMKEW